MLEQEHQTQHGAVHPAAAAAAAYLAAAECADASLCPQKLCDAAHIPMKELFYAAEDMQLRLRRAAPPPQLRALKNQFVVSTVAAKKYAELYHRLLAPARPAPRADAADASDAPRRLGWLVFLCAKLRLLPPSSSLLDAFHLLVAVVELLLAHQPPELRTTPVWGALGSVPHEAFPVPAQANATLCAELKCQPDDVAKMARRLSGVLAEQRALLEASGDGSAAGIPTLLASGAVAAAHADRLSHFYEAEWPGRSLLDERSLLPADVSAAAAGAAAANGGPSALMLSPPRPPRTAATPEASPRASATAAASSTSGGANPLLTPLRGSNPLARAVPRGTPISRQLESISWLREAVSAQPAAPTAKLLAYFDRCTPSATPLVAGRLERLSATVTSELLGEGCPFELVYDPDNDDRLALASRLYHKMLLVFLEAEEQRNKAAKFDALLASEQFHTSLFACCVEAVCASHHAADSVFPQILDVLELQAFDFCKVISSFLSYEPSLPPYMRAHFAEIEAMILESLAWRDDSPLHDLAAEYDATATPADGGSNAAVGRATAALEQFFRKVYYLAAARIQELCTRMLLPSALVRQVWECLKLTIDTPARSLLRGRHLDQIIMCTIYGVCKLNKRDEVAVTFRQIIEQYKRQPKVSPKVFREVLMATAEEPPMDIICFYNRIFITARKEVLMSVCKESRAARQDARAPPRSPHHSSNGGVASSSSADMEPPTTSPRLTDACGVPCSPQRVSATREVYLSQPRTPSASMTPRTKQLYAFGSSTAEKLSDINAQLIQQPGSEVAVRALRQLSNTPPHPHVVLQAASLMPSQVSDNGEAPQGAPSSESRKRRLADSDDFR